MGDGEDDEKKESNAGQRRVLSVPDGDAQRENLETIFGTRV